MRLSLGFTFLAQILAVVTSQVVVNVLPDHVTDGASIVQLTSQTSGFDAPKVLSLNSTTFDWWYFDVVSTDLDYSLVLVFFNSAPTGLWDGVPDLPSTLYGTVGITLPDGSALNSAVLGSQLTVITTDNGSSGSLNGTGWGWTSKPDMSQYEVIIDDPAAGIQGTVILNSVRDQHSAESPSLSDGIIQRGPGHFPCAPVTAGPGQTLDLGNGFGWANAVPGSTAEVAFNFNGTKVAFTGSGYHDKVRYPYHLRDVLGSTELIINRTGATSRPRRPSSPGSGATASSGPSTSSGSTRSRPTASSTSAAT